MTEYRIRFETSYDYDEFLKKAPSLRHFIPERIKSIEYPDLSKIQLKRQTKTKPKKPGFDWNSYYNNMPKFTKEKSEWLEFKIKIPDNLKEQFEQEFEIKITGKQSFWYSSRHHRYKDCYYTSDLDLKNQYPIYIPSKGRWDCCHTANSLIELDVTNFYIIVEEQELDRYSEYYDSSQLLMLPKKYFKEYELEPTWQSYQSMGPGPARNFAWEHSIGLGYDWHWVMDK